MKNVIYNPIYQIHKSPVGAVKCNDKVTMNIKVTKQYSLYDLRLIIKDDNNNLFKNLPLEVVSFDEYYNIYQITFKIEQTGLFWYYFEINDCYGIHYFASSSTLDAVLTDYMPISYQLLVTDNFKGSLNWFQGKVMYQIFVDRFYNGGVSHNRTNCIIHKNWNEIPNYLPVNNRILNNDFFGGDLLGVIEKLDYLKELNVGVIYFNPIFEAYSNHKYDTANYMKIDPMFGDDEIFQRLCSEAEKRGISVILDAVFNHTGDNSVYFNKYGEYNSLGAYQSKESKYYSWYSFIDYPNKYLSWWNFPELPSVNQESESYVEFITGKEGVINKWLNLGARGFRFDVIDELHDNFIEKINDTVKTNNPENIMIGEVWEDASHKVSYDHRRQYFNGKQIDSVMNYPLKNAILDFVKNGNGANLRNTMRNLVNNYPKHVLDSLMNILSTHDTIRLINNFSYFNYYELKKSEQASHLMTEKERVEAVKKIKMASLLEFTFPGVPAIYYGDEVGLEGWSDPFCRKTFPWNNMNQEILSWYKMLGELRKENVFADGEYQEEYIENSIYAFSRVKGKNKITVIVNNSYIDFVYNVNKGIDFIEKVNIKDYIVVKGQSVKVIKISE